MLASTQIMKRDTQRFISVPVRRATLLQPQSKPSSIKQKTSFLHLQPFVTEPMSSPFYVRAVCTASNNHCNGISQPHPNRMMKAYDHRHQQQLPKTRAVTSWSSSWSKQQQLLNAAGCKSTFYPHLLLVQNHVLWQQRRDAQHHRLYNSTISNDSTRTKEHDDDDNDKHEETSDDITKKKKPALRIRMKERAEEYRENAVEKYHEFRDHPSDTAKDTAKTAGEMIKLYGPVFIGTYLSVYVGTLAGLYTGIESGILDPVSLFGMLGHAGEDTSSTVHWVIDVMNKYSITQPYSHIVEENPSVANLAVAWILVKFLEPIRLVVSISVTPKVASTFGYTTAATTTSSFEGGGEKDLDNDAENTAVSSKADEKNNK